MVQTTADEIGQIYVPFINWVVLVGVLLLVIGIGSSSVLASAYGIAVSATMAITTVLTFFVMRNRWKWPRPVGAWKLVRFLAQPAGSERHARKYEQDRKNGGMEAGVGIEPAYTALQAAA